MWPLVPPLASDRRGTSGRVAGVLADAQRACTLCGPLSQELQAAPVLAGVGVQSGCRRLPPAAASAVNTLPAECRRELSLLTLHCLRLRQVPLTASQSRSLHPSFLTISHAPTPTPPRSWAARSSRTMRAAIDCLHKQSFARAVGGPCGGWACHSSQARWWQSGEQQAWI